MTSKFRSRKPFCLRQASESTPMYGAWYFVARELQESYDEVPASDWKFLSMIPGRFGRSNIPGLVRSAPPGANIVMIAFGRRATVVEVEPKEVAGRDKKSKEERRES